MNHELRILHKKFTEGKISRQEFREYIHTELDKLEDKLMEYSKIRCMRIFLPVICSL